MARNQRLNATITIGAAIEQSVRRNLDVVGRGLERVSGEIRTVTNRQKELDKERRVLERQGRAVDHLDQEYKELNATLARLADRQRRLKAVQDGVVRVGGSFRNMATEVGRTARTTAVGVTAVGAAIVGVANSTANAAFEVGLFANLSNATTDEFQRMAAAAQSVGIENDKMSDILKDVNDRVGDFLTTGGGPMADFFENVAPLVGVTAENFKDLSGPQALQLFVKSLQDAGLSQQEMTFYMEAMASDATALIPLLRDDAREMNRLADSAENVGAMFDEEAIAAAGRFREEMARTRQAVDGVKTMIGSELMPVVADLASEFTDFVAENRPQIEDFAESFADGVRRTVPILMEVGAGLASFSGEVAGVVSDVAEMVGGWENFGIVVGSVMASKAILSVGGVALSVGRLAVAVGALVAPAILAGLPVFAAGARAVGAALAANPIGAAVMAISLAAIALITNWEKVQPALQPIIDWLGAAFTWVWDNAIEPVVGALVDAGGNIVTAWESVREGLGAVLDWMGERFEWILGKIAPVVEGLKMVRNFGAAGVDAVGSLFGADDVPSGGSSGRLQTRAVGGAFAPGAVLVGERGPELRFESRAGFIATNRQLNGMADMADRIRGAAIGGASSAGQQVTQALTIAAGAIVINPAPGMDPRAIADAVLGELQRRQRGALYDGGAG